MAGLVLEIFCAPFIFMFRDVPKQKEKDADGNVVDAEDSGDAGNSGDGGDAVKESRASSCCGLFTYNSIPKVLFAQGVIMSLGSGMTVKFFPLFFQNDMHFNPTQVQGVYVAVPIAMALLSGLATLVAKRLGRVPTIIIFDVLGISCLVGMVYLKTLVSPLLLAAIYVVSLRALFGAVQVAVGALFSSGSWARAETILTRMYPNLPLRRAQLHRMLRFIPPGTHLPKVRTGLMNSTYPLANSIMMDCCPEHQRARWKSLESIMTFGWCGSAALGGYIADRHSYVFV